MVVEKLDPVPLDLINFKYDLKMSTRDRKQLSNDAVEMIKNYYLNADACYHEIVKPPSDTAESFVPAEVRKDLERLKEIDFLKLHGSLPVGDRKQWEAIQAKIAKDVKFLESARLINYSLVLAVIKVREEPNDDLATFKQKGNYLLSPSEKFAYAFGIANYLHEYNFEREERESNAFQVASVYAHRFLEGLNKIFKL